MKSICQNLLPLLQPQVPPVVVEEQYSGIVSLYLCNKVIISLVKESRE